MIQLIGLFCQFLDKIDYYRASKMSKIISVEFLPYSVYNNTHIRRSPQLNVETKNKNVDLLNIMHPIRLPQYSLIR